VRAVCAVAPLALLATSCSGKSDPYAASLARGSEHVELHGLVHQGGRQVRITGSGDFTNEPDRGRLTIDAGGKPFQQVFADGTIYVRARKTWVSRKLNDKSPQTPAQMFRAHVPARTDGGLVRSITVRNQTGAVTYDFSRYGEPVTVAVPRVKGSS
jgi:hypothetical protein